MIRVGPWSFQFDVDSDRTHSRVTGRRQRCEVVPVDCNWKSSHCYKWEVQVLQEHVILKAVYTQHIFAWRNMNDRYRAPGFWHHHSAGTWGIFVGMFLFWTKVEIAHAYCVSELPLVQFHNNIKKLQEYKIRLDRQLCNFFIDTTCVTGSQPGKSACVALVLRFVLENQWGLQAICRKVITSNTVAFRQQINQPLGFQISIRFFQCYRSQEWFCYMIHDISRSYLEMLFMFSSFVSLSKQEADGDLLGMKHFIFAITRECPLCAVARERN